MGQQLLFADEGIRPLPALKGQLLKWIGNKQRFAPAIVAFFPKNFGTYFEPFLGSGAVLATLAPERALATDTSRPLMEIWQALHDNPDQLKRWYAERWMRMKGADKVAVYEEVKTSYNASPNGADLVFLSRACYGGVVRFRQADGYMSTPCGAHVPISPDRFAARVDSWHARTRGATFQCADFESTMARAQRGDLIYCDPPYSHSQAILYGAQSFDLRRLLEVIASCKQRGAYVALSIDGTKKTGNMLCDLPIPEALFAREVLVDVGRSMLKRFQMAGQSLEGEVVQDRLLLTH